MLDKELLLSVERTARTQKTFTLESLRAELPKEKKYEEAIRAFYESAVVVQHGGRGRCVPAGQRGGTKQYKGIAELLEKGYSVYVEFTNLKQATGYPLPGEGMRAQIVNIVPIALPEPDGLTERTFKPVLSFEFDFSGFNRYNKNLASIIDYPEKKGEINSVSLMNSIEYPADEKLQVEVFGTLETPISLFRIIGITCCAAGIKERPGNPLVSDRGMKGRNARRHIRDESTGGRRPSTVETQ